MRDLDEVLYQRALGYCERLGDDQIVAVWKEVKRKLDEVLTSGLIKLIDAEQINDNGVKCLKWDVWQFI